MMQYKGSPKLILAVIIFFSKVWNLIKVYISFTKNNNVRDQANDQFGVSSRSSEDCHANGIDPSISMCDCDDDHVHGKETCCHDNTRCGDDEEEDEIYYYSDSESEENYALHPCCDDDYKGEKESRWEDVWTASASGFSDVKCEQRETLFDRPTPSPQNAPGQNNFEPENSFWPLQEIQ